MPRMPNTVTLYDPTAPRREPEPADRRGTAVSSLAGKVVGFIDNAKPNFDLLANDLGDLLLSKYGVARVIKRRKPSASVPATTDVIAELAETCDVVITGSGD